MVNNALCSRFGIDFDHRGGMFSGIKLQFPPALYDKSGSVAANMKQGTFPIAVLFKFFLDMLQRHREDGLKEMMRSFSDRLSVFPPVEMLCALVPT